MQTVKRGILMQPAELSPELLHDVTEARSSSRHASCIELVGVLEPTHDVHMLVLVPAEPARRNTASSAQPQSTKYRNHHNCTPRAFLPLLPCVCTVVVWSEVYGTGETANVTDHTELFHDKTEARESCMQNRSQALFFFPPSRSGKRNDPTMGWRASTAGTAQLLMTLLPRHRARLTPGMAARARALVMALMLINAQGGWVDAGNGQFLLICSVAALCSAAVV
jgi:hypothetical protein